MSAAVFSILRWLFVVGECSEITIIEANEEQTMPKIAVVQRAPVLLDKAATLKRAVESTAEAAAGGAKLIVFTEAFVPGYPAWIWRLRPGGDMALSDAIYAQLFANSVSLRADELAPLREEARRRGVSVVCGVDERDDEFGRTTLYNTLVVIGPDGALLNRHRKLMPTNPERMVWGFGDASGLKVVDTPCGRVGTLLCWENYMPLARYALYAQGLEIHIAPTYDNGDGWIGTLRHIAREGRCWVIGCGHFLRVSDIPDDFPEKRALYPDAGECINPGDSVVIAPGGAIVAGPLRGEEGILYADVDLERIASARRSFDVVGHYARPDVFQLHVNSTALTPVEFINPDSQAPGHR
jgi:nitrilase